MSLVSRTVGQPRKSAADCAAGTKSEEDAHDLKRAESLPFVGCWEDAPGFVQDNEYIKKGYRVNFNSIKRVVKSLFMLHNESMNVWSHLCGAILFIGLITYVAIWLSPRLMFPTFDIIKEQLSNYTAMQKHQTIPSTVPVDLISLQSR